MALRLGVEPPPKRNVEAAVETDTSVCDLGGCMPEIIRFPRLLTPKIVYLTIWMKLKPAFLADTLPGGTASTVSYSAR